jgi:hypothetical protein
MGLRHAIVSLGLRAGISVSKQAERDSVRRLIAGLHPVVTDVPLVRLGADGDGGYLVPDDLDGVTACFSPGVDDRATFESAVVERRIPCFLADRSVAGPPFENDLITFERKFLGAIDDDDTLTLDSWVGENAPGVSDLLLQMDIEGSEWIALLNCSPSTLRRFRMIVMEAHDLERLMDKHAFAIIDAVFSRLLQDFLLVHNHPNNFGRSVHVGDVVIPRVLEMTWLRKDRATVIDWARQFPHPLDVANDPRSPDVVLPRTWFGGRTAQPAPSPSHLAGARAGVVESSSG